MNIFISRLGYHYTRETIHSFDCVVRRLPDGTRRAIVANMGADGNQQLLDFMAANPGSVWERDCDRIPGWPESTLADLEDSRKEKQR